jgi:hypothetical protein
MTESDSPRSAVITGAADLLTAPLKDELAFYDALQSNDSAVKVLGDRVNGVAGISGQRLPLRAAADAGPWRSRDGKQCGA